METSHRALHLEDTSHPAEVGYHGESSVGEPWLLGAGSAWSWLRAAWEVWPPGKLRWISEHSRGPWMLPFLELGVWDAHSHGGHGYYCYSSSLICLLTS